MLSIAAAPSSRAASAPVQPSGAPEGAAGRSQPTAASEELEPAVVSHVRRPGATGEDTAAVDAPGKSDDAANSEELRRLKARDAEVRAHEQAHAAAAGAFGGAPSYEYQRGPDGRSYAVGGEVRIDVSAVSGDPEATIRKMMQVKRAALAPQSPSDADRAIAASANAAILDAQRELAAGSSAGRAEAVGAAIAGDTARAELSFNERRTAGAATYQAVAAPDTKHVIDVVS